MKRVMFVTLICMFFGTLASKARLWLRIPISTSWAGQSNRPVMNTPSSGYSLRGIVGLFREGYTSTSLKIKYSG